MPYTILLVLHRNPTITPAAFKSHYESTHMPLIQSIAGSTFPKSHTRHYIHRSEDGDGNSNITHPATVLIGTQADFDYEALAVLVFEDEAAYQRFFEVISREEAREKISKDEESFLQSERMRAVVLGEGGVSGPVMVG